MENIKQRNKIIEWLTNKIQGLVYRLDNTGDGDYEASGEMNFLRALGRSYFPADFTLFDIGANRGDYTEMAMKSFSTADKYFHLFEPQRSCVQVLKDKFSNVKGLTINDFGLSDQSGSAELYKDFDRSGLASLYERNLDHYDIKMNRKESIKLETGTDYLKRTQIEKIDLMKIDVEGHELSVLSGFGSFVTPQNVSLIQFEYGGANLDAHTSLLELFSYLEKRGYVMTKMMKKYLEIRKYHPRLENFMFSNYVAVSPKFIKS